MDYAVADLHLAHTKLAGLRGFPTAAAHDAAVMAPLYSLDPAADQLWVLGDICSGGLASMHSALEQLAALPVPVHLITGNHDPCHPMHRNVQRHFSAFAAVFASVQQAGRFTLGGESVLLSHLPYAGTPDRFSPREPGGFPTSASGCCTVTPTAPSAVQGGGRSACRLRPGNSGRHRRPS